MNLNMPLESLQFLFLCNINVCIKFWNVFNDLFFPSMQYERPMEKAVGNNVFVIPSD